jgi:hypothetical protein
MPEPEKMGKPTGKRNCDEGLVVALAGGASVSAAAAHAGVSDRTARRRLADPAFRTRVDEARGELVRQAVGRLSAIGVLAGDTLEGLIKGAASEAVRLGAARAVLEYMFRGQEIDALARQLDELERRLEGMADGSAIAN